jgi:hypothetical protein
MELPVGVLEDQDAVLAGELLGEVVVDDVEPEDEDVDVLVDELLLLELPAGVDEGSELATATGSVMPMAERLKSTAWRALPSLVDSLIVTVYVPTPR